MTWLYWAVKKNTEMQIERVQDMRRAEGQPGMHCPNATADGCSWFLSKGNGKQGREFSITQSSNHPQSLLVFQPTSERFAIG
jgi:hypothetical protein